MTVLNCSLFPLSHDSSGLRIPLVQGSIFSSDPECVFFLHASSGLAKLIFMAEDLTCQCKVIHMDYSFIDLATICQ